MKYIASLILGFLLASTAHGQVATSDEPGRVSERFEQPDQPLSQPSGIISLPGVIAPEGAASIILRVARIDITGSTIYSADELASLCADVLHRDIALAELYALAQTLTAKYGGDGFVLSRAFLPPQELDPAGAVVTIEIAEGFIDRVVWPEAATRYRDLFSEYAARITAERPTRIDTVMRYLLLASDLPGIDVTSRFEASTTNLNASTLVVDITHKPVDAFFQLDNRGTEARGPLQYSTGVTLNNLIGVHESLSVSNSGAIPPTELQHWSVAYRQVLNAEGLFFLADGSVSWGEPGTGALQALDFRSSSHSLDLVLGLPVIRSRDQNLTLTGVIFLSDSTGEMLGLPNSEDHLRGFRANADFDFIDALNGLTQGNLTFSQGVLGFGSTVNGNPLASRQNGRVDFTTLKGSLSHLRPLDHAFSILTAATGQYAFTPLLSSEECGYGGRDFGRAFDPSELTGDSCWIVSGELRFDPDLPGNPLSQTQLYAFVDYGQMFRIAPAAGTPSMNEGASAGFGIRLGNEFVTADLSAAKPLLGRIDDGWRFFVTANAHY